MSDSEENSDKIEAEDHDTSDNNSQGENDSQDFERESQTAPEAGESSPNKWKHEEDEHQDISKPTKKFCLPELKDTVDSWKLPDELATFFNQRCN